MDVLVASANFNAADCAGTLGPVVLAGPARFGSFSETVLMPSARRNDPWLFGPCDRGEAPVAEGTPLPSSTGRRRSIAAIKQRPGGAAHQQLRSDPMRGAHSRKLKRCHFRNVGSPRQWSVHNKVGVNFVLVF